MICPIRQHASQHPEQPALYLDGQPVSYGELDQRLNALGQQLDAAGLLAGDALGLIARNGLPTLLLIWAALRRQLILCPLNPALPEASQQTWCQRLAIQALWREAGPLAGHWQNLTPNWQARSPQGAARLDPAALCNKLLTSGSSGQAKVVVHRLAQHLANAQGSRQQIPLTRGDGWLLSLPLYHVGGFAIPLRCFAAGATLVLPDAKLPLKDQLRRDPISHLSLVPTQLWRLLAAPDFRLSQTRLRVLLLGGAPIPQALVAACQAQGLSPLVSYGLSEMGSQVCTRVCGSDSQVVGRPLPGREVCLQAGEICVRGETLFAGYETEDGLALPLDPAGWFHTRDKGEWTVDGELKVCGRLDNQFVCGGENIQPEQIEAALLEHPDVAQALVVPLADAQWGHRPVAFIQWHSGAAVDDLEAWLRQRLPGYLVPRHWLAWPAQEDGLKPSRREFAALAARQLAAPAQGA
ncbi:2-succinylbenzoate--CoA ligase [Pseudaeromonas paramecii]|uniref:2-succinylbenzoate--CoA ligase n=1 Tax=Pseudaeromonas paramecii TaxID=2138166 RepID=A0ABP8Q2D1_9GAMM